ncbi:peptidyl-prolyl cis-trans isomerase FKBP1B isoform X1 [Aplysia californica]|uniref:peptidylprolyl isomerase n=1 Tax=Aplysia californica TaxID=6500 RepID=A0ABM1VZY6_APLCA|nr:peptidyl-prolyl cis-trans isomerase FKBP1B isoform X1 [Aplysia californica]
MGVEKQIISPGDGATYPKTGQTVVIHYTASLVDGLKIDSSRDRGHPFKFRIGKGEVIKDEQGGASAISVLPRFCLWGSRLPWCYSKKCHPDFRHRASEDGMTAAPETIHHHLPKTSHHAAIFVL